MKQKLIFSILWMATLFACQLTSPQVRSTPFETAVVADTVPSLAPTAIQTGTSTEMPLPSETAGPLPSNTPLPTVESLKAIVTADLLSCRYGPGAEYLYLYALRKTANIKLIGRTDAELWSPQRGALLQPGGWVQFRAIS